MMNIPPFAETSKASVDQLFATSGKAFQGLEQLVALNLQVVKTSLVDIADLARSSLAAKDSTEAIKLQSSALQTIGPKAMAYVRQVLDILSRATAEQRATAEAQVAEAQAKFMEAMKGALKNAPGSDGALSLMTATVTATNNAYDGAKKASKQVTDAVDANVTKITEIAAKATD